MRLTLYTDYSLRVLLYLSSNPNRLVTITELADFYDISRNHLVKVVHELGLSGYIQTVRGKHGGIRLAKPADQIGIGEIVRKTEPDLNLLECFDPSVDKCRITQTCKLKGVLFQARRDFMQELDRHTLADLSKSPNNKDSGFKSIPILQD